MLPNLHRRRIWVPSEERFVTLRISCKGLRMIDKLGIEEVLSRMNQPSRGRRADEAVED